MAKVSTYINCLGNTEEAFNFYKKAFGTEFLIVTRFSDVGMPLPEEEANMLLHIELPILGGHVLMGTDMLRSAGHELQIGNNISINLEPDSREQAEQLYAALSEGSGDTAGLNDMPWGAYWGSFTDKFNILWMINFVDTVTQ